MNSSRALPPDSSERGVVLVVAILMVMAISILVGGFMFTTVGERAIASNVHVAKGSLYAADGGVRVTQQTLAAIAQGRLDSLAAIWTGNGPIISQPSLVFPAGTILTGSTNPRFFGGATIAFADSDLSDTAQVYNYVYTITSTGQHGGQGVRRVQSQGLLRVSASRGTFADYLLFTHSHLTPSGGAIWFTSSGSFDGRVHTNSQFRFAYQPTFMDLVTSVHNKAWYYNHGNPKELASDHNGTIDVPRFFGGFQRSAPVINLPPNSYGQQNAALGLSPAITTPPTNSQINTQLGLGSGSSPPPNGIYIPHTGGTVIGGIYIQGSLSEALMRVDGSGRQVYELEQGSTEHTITVDPAANQTIVDDGTSTVIYTGIPREVMYTNGAISDLRGPNRVSGVPPPALADGQGLLVAATGDIVIERDITYKDFHDGHSVLGIYSSAGSVRIGTSAPNNMSLDAFVMATGTSGSFTVDNYGSGSPRGTFHLRGGMVSTYYGAFYTFDFAGNLKTGYARDFHYDRRGLVPPYFPTTNRFVADEPAARTMVWKEV
jgi:hypothetical protein